MDRAAVMNLMGGFRGACVLGAAVELNVFSLIGSGVKSADELAQGAISDGRAMRMLLDACAALSLLTKTGERYGVPSELQPILSDGPQSMRPAILHHANILRSWSELARVVKTGKPAKHGPSILGEDADNASFIGAMHAISVAFADPVVASMGKLSFKHLLDVGGASGTWTIAFLKAVPEARATIVDLPHAIDQARGRFRGTPFESRVTLVEGSFFEGELPKGADFAWVSAIAHMFNREENRLLYRRVGEALAPKGRIAIRDIVMQDSRVAPVQGALFAINMLANTPTGGTFTFEEYAEDLRQSGFVSPELKVSTEDMNSIVWAIKK